MKKPFRILIIEDSEDIRETVVEILEMNGYLTEQAVNGKDGVLKATENRPDLIICDIMMPELDGYQVVKLLRQNPYLRATPFVFLTAKSAPQDFREGMQKGADDYLTKPFEIEDLLNTVKLRLDKVTTLRAENKANIMKLREKLDEQKSRINAFNFMNSHRVRGPLARILGIINLITMEQANNQNAYDANLINKLTESCQQLDEVISSLNDILNAK